MKSMRPPLVAIFFMTYFYRAKESPWPRWPTPESATAFINIEMTMHNGVFPKWSRTLVEFSEFRE